MGSLPLEVQRGSLRLQAYPNGKATVPVALWDGEVLLKQDAINPTREREREAFCEGLVDGVRAEALDALTDLGLEVAQIRSQQSATIGTATPALEPWPEPVDGATLLRELGVFVTRRVVLPQHAAVALALWIVHTWMLKAAYFTPYIWVSSPVRECGKTTLLDVLAVLACQARQADSVSPAAMRRYIEATQPTLLLDELDTQLHRDGADELRQVLNSGFKWNGLAMICDGEKNEVREFRVFCPKVLAGIGRLWDTVASRSIPIPLRKATREELGGLESIRGDRLEAVGEPLRQQCRRWALDHLAELEDWDPAVPPELGARQGDIWRPLLAIAELAGGPWPTRARKAAVSLHADAEEHDTGLVILEDIRAIFQRLGRPRLHTATLVSELVAMEDRPWPEYSHGRPLTPKGLASLLSRFGLKPEKPWREEGEPARGYMAAAFEAVWGRYLSTPELSVASVTGCDPLRPTHPVTNDLPLSCTPPQKIVTGVTDVPEVAPHSAVGCGEGVDL